MSNIKPEDKDAMRSPKVNLFIAIVAMACAAMACIESGYSPYVRPNPSTLPSSLMFTDSKCMAGCWHDLRPGQTNTSQLENILTTLNLPLSWSGVDKGGYKWFERSDNTPNHYTLTAYMNGDVLVLLFLSGPFNLTIKQVIDQLGKPKYFFIGQSSTDVTETASLPIVLYYPDLGLVFSIRYFDQVNAERIFNLCMSDQDLINDIFVTQEGTIENVINSVSAPGNYRDPQEIPSQLKTWPDYGCSKQKY